MKAIQKKTKSSAATIIYLNFPRIILSAWRIESEQAKHTVMSSWPNQGFQGKTVTMKVNPLETPKLSAGTGTHLSSASTLVSLVGLIAMLQ